MSVGASEVAGFKDFSRLSSEAVGKLVPVNFKGTVLCYDLDWNQLYLDDGTEAGWLDPKLFPTNFAVGSVIEITGAATFAVGGPAWTNLNARFISTVALPKPEKLALNEFDKAAGQWVETTGRVRVADTSSGRLGLVIQDVSQTCVVYVLGSTPTDDFKSLLGSRIRVRGINASKKSENSEVAAILFAPGMHEIVVLEAADQKPAQLSVISIDELLNRPLRAWTNDLVRLQGVVISYEPGKTMVIKDATGVLRAQLAQLTSARAGDRIDLWGYLAASPESVLLRDAYFEPQRTTSAAITQANVSVFDAQRSTNKFSTISNLSQISKLTPAEADQGIPIRAVGVVTYADSDWRNCFVQDQSGAVYLDLSQGDVSVGQVVEVTGQTSRGGFAPQVVHAQVRVLGTTNLPAPVKTDLEDLAGGHLDCRWVQMEGIIRQVSEEWGHARLVVMTSKGRFRVIIPGLQQPLPGNLVDSYVSVRGACSSEMNPRGQLAGITLHVPGLEHIKILEAVPADPFAIRTIPISSVATFDPSHLAGRRIRLSGTVTMVQPDEGFYIQDDSGGIRIKTSRTTGIKAGQSVDVLGFPTLGDFSPCLEEAIVRSNGESAIPAPAVTTAAEILFTGLHDATRVELEGHLIQSSPHAANPRFVLQSGTVIFAVSLGTPSGDGKLAFQAGSLLRVTGVCSIQGGEAHEPNAFKLLVSDADDITLLASPSWWTLRHTLMLFGGLTLGGLAAWAWNSSLRRRVRMQTDVIKQHQEELLTVSRQAGMAEVATAVLHNVGNVLNSVNVSAALATDALEKSRASNVALVADLLKSNANNLGAFMTQDPKGARVPDYLGKLGKHLAEERAFLLGELKGLSSNIQHINEIVAMQQSYAKVGGVVETVPVADLVEDAFRLNLGALERHKIRIVRDYGTTAKITVEKHKALQILVNLMSNAKYACDGGSEPEKRLTVRLVDVEGRIRISVVDNGMGIPAENLTRIFSHGFTTRTGGHGFGLHSSALAANEMGGSLQVHSEGPGRGATFTLELPLAPEQS